jgi:hypothetical protein
VKAKNNLAKDTAALTYTVNVLCVGYDERLRKDIWAPYVVFGAEHREITATEAMQAEAGIGNTRDTAQQAAEAFLRERLASGPVLRDDVIEEAKVHMFSDATLRRAREKLGVVFQKEKGRLHGKWFWELPAAEVVQT